MYKIFIYRFSTDIFVDLVYKNFKISLFCSILKFKYTKGRYSEGISDKQIMDVKEKKVYYDNGQIKMIGFLLEGEIWGEWKYFYPDGTLNISAHMNNNTFDGKWKSYFKNGNLSTEGEFDSGDINGFWTYYFENRKVEVKGQWNKGKRIGDWDYYYYSGNLKRREKYEDNLLVEVREFNPKEN